jgi:LysR family transcriptional regulator, transcriptional activator of the cysJI operon
MDFELLQLFVDICDLGSFSKAAGRHIVSQSAVSQRVAQLERRLAQSLFDRKARPLSLTPAGQIVYDSAKQLLAIHSQMQAHLEDLQPMLSGPVRLGCIFSLALGPLRHMLRQFLRDAVSVELHVTHGETYELAQDVLNGLIDLALVAYGEKSEGIQIEDIGKEPMILVGPPGEKKPPTAPVPGSWMNQRHLVTFPHHSPTRRAIEEAFSRIQVTPTIVLEVANPVILVEAVAAGRGCALMPFSSAISALEQNEIVYIPCPELEFDRPICLMLHRRRPRTRAVRALADFLAQQMSSLQGTWKGSLEKVAFVAK